MELGLFQRQVADQLGVDEASVHNWETDQREPELGFLPSIYSWLGYCPVGPAPASIGERLLVWRRAQGVSQREAAARVGLDPGTVRRIEQGRLGSPSRRVRRSIETLLRTAAVNARTSRENGTAAP